MKKIESETPEPIEPNPPRWWWTKRLVVAGVVLTMLYVGVFLAWKYEANRRLQAEIDEVHARGEPILVEDFAVDPVPDELNAAVTYNATKLITSSLPKELERFLRDFELFFEVDPASRDQMQKIYSLITPALNEARKARFQSEADWGVRLKSPTFNSYPLYSVSPRQHLATAMRLAVFEEHLRGDDSAAIETARDLLRYSDAMRDRDSSLIAHLTSIGVGSRVSETLHRIAHDLQILPGNTTTTQPNGPASREQITALIGDLLDDGKLREGLKAGMYAERMYYLDSLMTSPASAVGLPSLPAESLLKPLFTIEAIRLIRYVNHTITAASFSTYPAAIAGVRENRSSWVQWESTTMATQLTKVPHRLLAVYERNFLTHFDSIARRRAIAISLAIRLYQLDHSGAYPTRLEELVPTYLPEMPEDPFAAGKRPFGYQTAPMRMLISVGEDGKDDSGDLTALERFRPFGGDKFPPGHIRDPHRLDRKDLVFILGDPTLKGIPQNKLKTATVEDSTPSPQDPSMQPATQPAE